MLAYSFDNNKATDISGHKNNGTLHGVGGGRGKIGRGLRFGGPNSQSLPFNVNHRWTQALPIFARALVLADGTLFVAGPPDLIDEEQAYKNIDDPKVQGKIAAQAEAYAGRQKASLWAVSAADGKKLCEHKFEALPMYNGMAAAGSKLFIFCEDGQVRCFGGI